MADTATKQTDPPCYEVIAAAVLGNPDTVNLVIRHYSGCIALLAARKGYGEDGVLRPMWMTSFARGWKQS